MIEVNQGVGKTRMAGADLAGLGRVCTGRVERVPLLCSNEASKKAGDNL